MTELERAVERIDSWISEDPHNRGLRTMAARSGRRQAWVHEPSHEVYGDWSNGLPSALISLAEKLKGEAK